MKGFLLDTNVVSELRKRERCDPRVRKWAECVAHEDHYLSVIVIGELKRGAALKQKNDPTTALALRNWIAKLTRQYGERILPITLPIAERWGEIGAIRPIPPEDGLLAATALVHDLTLVTRNLKNVQNLGEEVLNPWNG